MTEIERENLKNEMIERFFKYVKIDTKSDPDSLTCPSTEIQFNLANIIVEDMKKIGLTDITIDKNGYIMGTLEGNKDNIPTIGFISHMDTAPNFSGTNVSPRIIKNYDGKDIILNEKEKIISYVKNFPELKNYIGQDLIVTDGLTLLGADDKAGVTEILEAMKFLKDNPSIKHGKIRIAFTPDEEIGRGADLFDVDKFGADFAYTIDGGEIGELEFENFNAASASVEISGRDIHPGYAKDKMINSILLAMEFNSMLPVNERPEYTDNYEGFFMISDFNGTVENTKLEYIIRDHSFEKFKEKKNIFEEAALFLQKKYKETVVKFKIEDSYYNMREKIEPVYHIIELAQKSMKDIGVVPKIKAIRGGTDGARLSYMGLPCPNIFTGGHNFHGKHEYICIQSMEKARDLIVKIVENLAK